MKSGLFTTLGNEDTAVQPLSDLAVFHQFVAFAAYDMSPGGAALKPTFQGRVATTQDALILFEACLQGHLAHVHRRPHDRERSSLIRSGSVFIYEENASGIKRWTDGVTWSPSRILGNFFGYRELQRPFSPGKKKRATKKQQRR